LRRAEDAKPPAGDRAFGARSCDHRSFFGKRLGIDLIRSVRSLFPNVAVIVLSMHDESVYAERSIRAGARGYIMKRESTKKIVDAIHHVLQGDMYLSKELTELFAKSSFRDRCR